VVNLLVNLDVDDLDKAVNFYSSVFGLTVGRRLGDVGLEMLGGSSPIYLLERSATAPAETSSQARTYQRHWTPVHLDFVVDELEPVVERAVLAGALLEKPIQVFGWGKLALMADPFGHGFCVVQLVGRGYDEIAE
jgi:predicted enzyme related to lactoylglutathione lyase